MVEYAYKWIEAYLSGEAVNEKYTHPQMYACAIDRVILVGAAAKPRDLNSQLSILF